MRNKIFQWIYFKLVRPLIRMEGTGIESQYRYMIGQWRLAWFLGGVKTVILGDSNAAAMQYFSVMKIFKKITVNIAKGGTTAHDWINFIFTVRGQKIYNKIWDKNIIVNIGGNYSLQHKMQQMKNGLKDLHHILPNSYALTIPTLYYNILDFLDGIPEKTMTDWMEEIHLINDQIRILWKDKCIDIAKSALFGQITPIIGTLKDVVHISRKAAQFIIKFLKYA